MRYCELVCWSSILARDRLGGWGIPKSSEQDRFDPATVTLPRACLRALPAVPVTPVLDDARALVPSFLSLNARRRQPLSRLWLPLDSQRRQTPPHSESQLMSIGPGGIDTATSLTLPPEIIAIVIETLDKRNDLLTCSLVCRGWLHFARNNLEISINSESAPTFVQLIASPNNTLVSALRHLDIWCHDSLVLQPLFSAFANFVSLRWLSLWTIVPQDLTAPPGLIHLRMLNTEFPSYSGFANFMSDLPALQSLELSSVSWAPGPDDGNYSLPRLELKSLELEWDETPRMESVIFAFRPRKFIVAFPLKPFPSLWSTTSAFLRHLGPDLKHLELYDCEDHIGQHLTLRLRKSRARLTRWLDRITRLDFRSNTGLEQLKISDALRLNVVGDQFEVGVRPALEGLLSQIMPYSRVEGLILKVETDSLSNPSAWIPLAQFSDLLDTPPFATAPPTLQESTSSQFCGLPFPAAAIA
ncbi:hypothetical protein DFH09DRAFT_1283638 [Mycena vulgaris]|nr:hypothetical protein DFH09DRAFT_1283638 [Mycena vulgaris]